MQVQIAPPVAIEGLHESFGPAYDDSRRILDVVQREINACRDRRGQWQATYRNWSFALRQIRDRSTDEHEQSEAKQMLKTILLNTTLPANELETPDWVDAMTGEMDPTFEEMIPDRRAKGIDALVDAVLEVPEHDGQPIAAGITAIPMALPSWPAYVATRNPYPTAEENAAFVRANMEGVQIVDEPEPFDDDRGFVPDTLEPDTPQPSPDLPRLRREIKPEADALRVFISNMVEDLGTRKAKKIREAVQESEEASDWFAQLQRLANQGEEPADIAMLFLMFQHGFAFDLEHAERVRLPYMPHDAAGDTTPHTVTLLEWLEEFGDALDASDPLPRGHMTDEEILAEVERLTEEFINANPVQGTIIHSRYFIEGWINAVCAGTKDPAPAAWDHWRQKTNPEANAAYWAARHRGASERNAMSLYYNMAGIKGQPKTIVAIRKSGLVIRDNRGDREVSWTTCNRILKQEGFALEGEKRNKLLEALTQRGWGKHFLATLKSWPA